MRATPKTSSPAKKRRSARSVVRRPRNLQSRRAKRTIADGGAQGDVLLGGSDLLGGHFGGLSTSGSWALEMQNLSQEREELIVVGFGGGLVAGI